MTADEPQAGDISLCLLCGAPLELRAAGIAPRWLTYDDVAELPADLRGLLVSGLVSIVTMRPSRVRAIK